MPLETNTTMLSRPNRRGRGMQWRLQNQSLSRSIINRLLYCSAIIRW